MPLSRSSACCNLQTLLFYFLVQTVSRPIMRHNRSVQLLCHFKCDAADADDGVVVGLANVENAIAIFFVVLFPPLLGLCLALSVLISG